MTNSRTRESFHLIKTKGTTACRTQVTQLMKLSGHKENIPRGGRAHSLTRPPNLKDDLATVLVIFGYQSINWF